jgi:hypothetical protein
MSTTRDTEVALFRYREAFQRIQPELDRVDPKALSRVDLDIPTVVAAVLARYPAIAPYRDGLSRLLGFDLASFDKLETYALATAYAHDQYLASSAPPPIVEELTEELKRLRSAFLWDATALAARGLLDGTKLKLLRGPVGAENLLHDASLLKALLESEWPEIAGKTAIDRDELARSERVSLELAKVVAQHAKAPAKTDGSLEDRQRALTLLSNAYDEVRRGLTYLRWNAGDVDTILPPLHAVSLQMKVGPEPKRPSR